MVLVENGVVITLFAHSFGHPIHLRLGWKDKPVHLVYDWKQLGDSMGDSSTCRSMGDSSTCRSCICSPVLDENRSVID